MYSQKVSASAYAGDTFDGTSGALTVRKRDGSVEDFDAGRISRAIEKAFRADAGLIENEPLPHGTAREIQRLTHAIVDRCLDLSAGGRQLEVEGVQDLVEAELMRAIHHGVARRYILYREDRRRARVLRSAPAAGGSSGAALSVRKRDGTIQPLDPEKIRRRFALACQGLEARCSPDILMADALRHLRDGASSADIDEAVIRAATTGTDREPSRSAVAAGLLLQRIYKQALPRGAMDRIEEVHRTHFRDYLRHGVDAEQLSPELLDFDPRAITAALCVERDRQFPYAGLRAMHDRFLLRIGKRCIETPQYFWMRVAMGLALHEGNRSAQRAVEFYNVLSSYLFMIASPAVLYAGTIRSQAGTPFLSTSVSNLDDVFQIVFGEAGPSGSASRVLSQ